MTTRVGSASSADRCATRPRRSAAAGLDETALLRGCDRSMLGTVQRQRAAAQEPEDESEGDRETRDQRNAMREECEQKRSGDRGCEQQAFPRLRDATAAEERRQGEP